MLTNSQDPAQLLRNLFGLRKKRPLSRIVQLAAMDADSWGIGPIHADRAPDRRETD